MKKSAAASVFVWLGLVTVLASSAAPLHAETPDGGDLPDSGYQSTFLSTLNKTNVTEAQATMARAESVRESRGNVQGFAARAMQQAAQQRALYPNLMPGATAPSGVPSWFNIGPFKENYIQNDIVTLQKTDSGRLRTIAADPTNPDIVYVLTCSGGLWKTTNFTHSKPNWFPLTDGLSTTSGGAMALGHNPKTIYLGLGDPFAGNGLTGGLILKSTDGGVTWGPYFNFYTAGSVRDVKTEWYNGHDIVIAATDGGIWVSTDDGTSYSLATDAPLIDAYGYLKEGWSIANTSAGWLVTTRAAFVGGATDGLGEMVYSNDHGASWHSIANTGGVFTGAGRSTVGVGAPGDSVVYDFAETQDESDQLDLFRSTDGGQSWTALNITNRPPTNPNPEEWTVDLMSSQSWYNQALLVDPRDPARNTVYLGGQLASARSTDGGQTLTLTSNWLAQFDLPYVHADFHAAAFLPNGNKTMIAFGTDGGLFTSLDGGNTWDDSRNTGLITTLHYSMASTPSHPASALSGLQDNGSFVRWGNTDIWEQSNGGDGFGTGWSQANDAIALSSVYFEFIFANDNRDPNRQKKWSLSYSGIDLDYANFYTAIATPSAAADSTGLAFYTYTGRQIYRTGDGAQSWTDIGHTVYYDTSGNIVPPSPGIGTGRVFRDTPHGIGVSPASDGQNHVAVVCNSGWVVYTHDGGQTWHQTRLIGTVANWFGYQSTAEWADDNTLYIGSESSYPEGRVAKSTDGGAHFILSDTGLPDVPVNRVLVNPVSKNTVYAATFLGVYRSTDGGNSWSRYGAGLPFVEVRDLYMPPDGSFLRIATYGRGVWELTP